MPIDKIIRPPARSFPSPYSVWLLRRTCAVTKVQEFFYCPGAEAVDRTHLTVEFRHQVHRAFLIWIDQHTVDHQLFFRGEHLEKPFQAAHMIDGQLQGGQEAAALFPQGNYIRVGRMGGRFSSGRSRLSNTFQISGDAGDVIVHDLDRKAVTLQIPEIGQEAILVILRY